MQIISLWLHFPSLNPAVFHFFTFYFYVYFFFLLSLTCWSSYRWLFVVLFLSCCSFVLPVLHFNDTFPWNTFHVTKPTFPVFLPFCPHFLCFPSLFSLPPHSWPFHPFLPASIPLILAASSLQQCSVWFDLSVCWAATPPCFHLTRADEACGHFTTAHFQSGECFLESLCVPDQCLHYHTVLLALMVFHHIHADNDTTFITIYYYKKGLICPLPEVLTLLKAS